MRRAADHGAVLRLSAAERSWGRAHAEVRELDRALAVQLTLRGDARARCRSRAEIERASSSPDAHASFSSKARWRRRFLSHALYELMTMYAMSPCSTKSYTCHDVGVVEPRDGLSLAHESHRVFLGRVLVIHVALQGWS